MAKYKKYIIPFIFVLLFVLVGTEAYSQCPMCRMTAESNLANGGKAGKGLNAGILYIFVFPYLLVSVIGFIWWRNNRKKKQED